ncbi:MAG: hypothetical protein LBD74_01250, partial [Spirochaetaceae bacterium]|nr:hypothetical protein [Spirochaetaceae bacterium]
MDLSSEERPRKKPQMPQESGNKKPKKKSFPVWWVLFSLGVLIAGGLCWAFIFPRPQRVQHGASFYQALGEFDALLEQTPDIYQRDSSIRLNRALDALEKQSFGLEPTLSLLKRRR